MNRPPELRGHDTGSLNIYISSEEILQTSFGLNIAKKATSLFPQAKTQFTIRTEEAAINQVLNGESHLALITLDPPPNLAAKVLAKVEFELCATRHHPLVKKYGRKAIPIEEVLKYSFVAPDSAILGKFSNSASIDGWRDNKFPRQIKYKVCGLKLMENIIHDGMALGFLPDYFIKNANLVPLNISGCPYTSQQTVRVVAKDPAALGWLNKLWDQI